MGGHSGSGFVIQEKGFIVTAAHVVDKPAITYLWVQRNSHFSNIRYPAEVIYIDKYDDVAILKVSMSVTWKDTLKLHSDTTVERGLRIFKVASCMGHPNFFRFDGKTLFDYKAKVFSMNYKGFANSMPIQPGCSGGAVVGPKGKVLGVNSLLVTNPFGTLYSVAAPVVKLRRRIKACIGELSEYKDTLCREVQDKTN